MPFNLLKKYPELLEILHLGDKERKASLYRVYRRDIEDNEAFKVSGKACLSHQIGWRDRYAAGVHAPNDN